MFSKNASKFELDLPIRKWGMIYSYLDRNNGWSSTMLESFATIEDDLDFINVIPSANTSKLIKFLSFTLVWKNREFPKFVTRFYRKMINRRWNKKGKKEEEKAAREAVVSTALFRNRLKMLRRLSNMLKVLNFILLGIVLVKKSSQIHLLSWKLIRFFKNIK